VALYAMAPKALIWNDLGVSEMTPNNLGDIYGQCVFMPDSPFCCAGRQAIFKVTGTNAV
jgi:hypothetical protein